MARAKGRRSNRRATNSGSRDECRRCDRAQHRFMTRSRFGDLDSWRSCWWSSPSSSRSAARSPGRFSSTTSRASAQHDNRAIVAAVDSAASAVSRRGVRPSRCQLLARRQLRDQPSARRRSNSWCPAPHARGWISHCKYPHPLFEWIAAVRRHSPNCARGSLCAMVVGAGYAGRGRHHRLARASASDRSR